MPPLTAQELGKDFNLDQSLRFGHLPAVFQETDPKAFLKSYVHTYLDEEVRQEGLTRNMAAFARFMESASFSQGAVLNGDSGPNRPPNPIQIGHRFRSKSATCSGANRPGIPMQIGHPFEG
jgi:hypothetical protein